MIQVRISKAFPSFLLEVEFEAGPGVTVLFGPSGAGKTLTLDSIAGMMQPDSGRILLNDRILYDSGAHVSLPARARRCGYVFQNYALFPHMTLWENLAFAAPDLARLERHRKIGELLERFGLAALAGRLPMELSGGQKQRGSIARALMTEPEILLLDEPARGLDLHLKQDLYSVIGELRKSLKIPVLLVTHGVEEVFALGDHVLLYEPGRMIHRATPLELLRNPGSEAVAKLLGDFNLFDAEVLALDPGRQTSRIRLLGEEMQAPYFPGCFLGDKIRVCARPEELRVQNRPGANRVRADILSRLDRPQSLRLNFGDGLLVDAPRDTLLEGPLWVELPAEALRRLAG